MASVGGVDDSTVGNAAAQQDQGFGWRIGARRCLPLVLFQLRVPDLIGVDQAGANRDIRSRQIHFLVGQILYVTQVHAS